MFASIKLHRVLSILVFLAAAFWVSTGKFSAVGNGEEYNTAAVTNTTTDTATNTTTESAPESGQAAEGPALRTVAAVVPQFFEHMREINLFGATNADKQAVLAARSSGIVSQLGVTKGASVAEGATVLVLEGAEVEAQVVTAMAGLNQARQLLDVGEELFARGSLPEIELNSRRANHAAAEAALSQAQASAGRLSLQAPFGGLVDSVSVELGEWVVQGTPIATILSLDPIVIKAEVSEQDVGYVTVGDRAKVLLVGGVEAEGTIRFVAKQANERTRTFEVEVELPNPDLAIPSGATAEVRLYGAPATAMLVPRSVITLSDAGEIGVRVVGADNIARFAPVTLLDDTEQGMIISGVPEGVRVITAGQDLVRDGDQVNVSDVSADAPVISQ